MDEYLFFLRKADWLRLAVCSVLAMEPKILIGDEPTAGQDKRQFYEVMDLIKELNERGHTVIFITHNMRLVAEYASMR